MPANAADGNPLQLDLSLNPPPVEIVALAASDIPLQDESSEPEEAVPKPIPCRPPMIYTRPQLLHLQSSPLVKPPPNMPELKHWFGEHEASSKKDSEPSTPNSARERRFRRDAEDGEPSTRPSFRSTLSQPSQMGNFKHQSLRDRDRDRDGDKERERDIRDKEGQERLRNLSDKYDRDRLAAPGLRNKERDVAPHLAVDPSVRGSSQLSAAARRAEARDATKKKVGESTEDWRRGSTRQERYENSRSNREDLEGGRTRVRDPSRSRRDPSSSRPVRDRDAEDKERRPSREDRRTREDHRRERDRERELDRDANKEEGDDSRRWRDDGKRDERIAARRAGERQEKAPQENGESSGDRRWTVVEERDGRSKRNHRDRRTGVDDGKDKEDRRDRDRDREKEPAWMDTYIPEKPVILGGKGPDGELDGIQAWKKGLKEQKEKAAMAPKTEGEHAALPEPTAEKPLDEIQIFRMMMKREEEKKLETPASEATATSSHHVPPLPGSHPKTSQGTQTPQLAETTVAQGLNKHVPSPPRATSSAAFTSTSTHTPDSNSLLSILGKAEPITRPSPLVNPAPTVDHSVDKHQPPTSSRFFPNPIQQQNSAASDPEKPPIPDATSTTTHFNLPQGSRVLAFGARSTAKPSGLPLPLNGLNQPDSTSTHTGLPNPSGLPHEVPLNHGSPSPVKSDSLRSGFSPFDEQSLSAGADSLRRGDRSGYGLASEAGTYSESQVFDPSAGGYTTGKGSRFAKFFDNKSRETQAHQNPVGFTSSSPNPGQRHEGSFNPVDHRAMDGLLSKLNNSAQIQRPNIMSPNSAPSAGGVSFGQQAQNSLQILQQHQQHSQQHSQQQQLHLNNRLDRLDRLDPLYDSRLDDRFVPDGMVPGLRSAPPPRSRDSGLYSEPLEDSLHFNQPRIPPQHHQRGLEPMYNPVPSAYGQQVGRNAGIPVQPQFRGAPSPISNAQQQRLPPGLANLGGRPPLDGSQFMGMPGMPSAGAHSALHANGPPPAPQQFNSNFGVSGNISYGAGLQPQMRGVPPSQLQGNLQQLHQLANLGHPNMDLRAASQAQLLGLGGAGIRGGIGLGGGGFGPQQGQMQQPLQHALRQQEQQQLLQRQQQQQLPPPHMLAHHHLQGGAAQQQQGNNGPDLMALLMGGTTHHRE